MNTKSLSLILEEEVLKKLIKDADREGLSVEEYILRVLEEFNNVKWRRKNYSIIR